QSRALIAIHDTTLGPAFGRCRMYPYASEQHAMTDVLRLSRGMIYKAAICELPLWRRRSTPCLSPIAPRTSSLAVQTQRRRLPLAPLKGASPLFLENRRGDGPCLPSSNPPSSVMLAGQLLGINPQTPAQVALAPSSRPKPPPMPVAPCMSGGRGRTPDRESQGSQRTRWWREVDSNPRSRANRTTARHCFLVPFVTTPVLPKGLILPRPGDHSEVDPLSWSPS